jgi:integrase
MTTLGFGDIVFETDLGRMYSVVVLLTGALLILILLPFTFIQLVYLPWRSAVREARTPRSLPQDTEGHLVLTGRSPMERSLMRRASTVGVPYVLLVEDIEEAAALHDDGYPVMVGDLDDPATYRAARVDQAAMVVTARSDQANCNVAFTVREVTDRGLVIATAHSADAVDVLHLAGADCVLQLGRMLAERIRNERRKRIRTWSAAEVNSFAAFIQGHELHELWALAASTGLRRSELLGLRWIDLDLHRRLLSVRRVLVKVGGTAQFKDAPKSAHGFRTISIPPRVTQLLTELREWQADQPLLRIVPPEQALVFCRPDGDPWHPDHVSTTLRELVLASGLPRIRPMQDLRHTHATLLIGEGGVNVKVVQERLGHHSHSFTADTYQHVIPGMDEAAADRFDSLVFGDDGGE